MPDLFSSKQHAIESNRNSFNTINVMVDPETKILEKSHPAFIISPKSGEGISGLLSPNFEQPMALIEE
jgi:hypothetical protein